MLVVPRKRCAMSSGPTSSGATRVTSRPPRPPRRAAEGVGSCPGPIFPRRAPRDASALAPLGGTYQSNLAAPAVRSADPLDRHVTDAGALPLLRAGGGGP